MPCVIEPRVGTKLHFGVNEGGAHVWQRNRIIIAIIIAPACHLRTLDTRQAVSSRWSSQARARRHVIHSVRFLKCGHGTARAPSAREVRSHARVKFARLSAHAPSRVLFNAHKRSAYIGKFSSTKEKLNNCSSSNGLISSPSTRNGGKRRAIWISRLCSKHLSKQRKGGNGR